MKTKQTYWIHKTITECPVCGSERVTRQRVYGEKPTEYWQRVEVVQVYNYCDV